MISNRIKANLQNKTTNIHLIKHEWLIMTKIKFVFEDLCSWNLDLRNIFKLYWKKKFTFNPNLTFNIEVIVYRSFWLAEIKTILVTMVHVDKSIIDCPYCAVMGMNLNFVLQSKFSDQRKFLNFVSGRCWDWFHSFWVLHN